MDIFRDGDVCSVGFLVLILLSVGGMMVQRRPDLHQRGQRIAAVAFVGYLIAGGYATNANNASDWAALAFRGSSRRGSCSPWHGWC